MILPDVNVLIYAFRRDSARHDEYHRWLEDMINGDAAYGIAPQVLSSLIRISSHRGIYRHPSPVAESLAFCEALLQPEHCTVIQAGARHWNIFVDLCRRSRATGNLVQDAWFAALAIESGCEWITTDRDYARFAGLRWREPF
ncbi:MAG TPA: type II toxin-antitoxin system VapC family toxin [Vicinamibacterales bacterium]|nr:type II toxin-antitoxin system VapC family toxin [Vicinamibacterales bacterium]